MSDKTTFEPIKPVDIPLSQPVKDTFDDIQSPAPKTSPRRQLYGLSLVSALLLLTTFVYLSRYTTDHDATNPGKASSVTTDLSNNENTPPNTSDRAHLALAPSPPLQESPFQEAQLAAIRRAAQDILARVLKKQRSLEEKNIQQWAVEGYQQALTAASEGDQLYRNRQFEAAIEHYKTAEIRLDKLNSEIEPRIALLLSQGLAAISQGQASIAQQAFQQILLISPGHPQALQGKQRSESLPDVFAATQRGMALQAEGDYTGALAQYTHALSLDKLFEPALNGQKKAQELLNKAQFQSAINQGYLHLKDDDLFSARNHFTQALQIFPQSDTAQNALAQVDNELAQQVITRLLMRAQENEDKEQWESALNTYEKILVRDPTITAATIGKIRSGTRHRLDAKLQKLITQPLRLASPVVYREARQSLADAKQISQAGQRLNHQIQALDQLLINAQIPQTVILRSDNATRVSIFKLGEFNPFTQKTIQLKPGKYIAEGIRPGFRDVRVEFTVFGAHTSPVVIQCREAI